MYWKLAFLFGQIPPFRDNNKDTRLMSMDMKLGSLADLRTIKRWLLACLILTLHVLDPLYLLLTKEFISMTNFWSTRTWILWTWMTPDMILFVRLTYNNYKLVHIWKKHESCQHCFLWANTCPESKTKTLEILWPLI